MKSMSKPKGRSAPSEPSEPSAQAVAILDISERLVQTSGYNGFSYADIAVELGVTKASLHYHFPTKEALGLALVERYTTAFTAALRSITGSGHAPLAKLRDYVALYDSVLRDERMCLCGMLAAEYSTLPVRMQEALKAFFDANEHWLSEVLAEGRQSGAFTFKESAKDRARVILGALEGAMLIARSYEDPRRFKVAAQHVLADLCPRSL